MKLSRWFYEGRAPAPLYEDYPSPYVSPVYTDLSEVTEEEWAEAARIQTERRARCRLHQRNAARRYKRKLLCKKT